MHAHDPSRLADFFTSERQAFSGLVFSLLEDLRNRIDYKLKIQKASIQLIHSEPFAAFGFRKAKNSMFVEFYSDSVIRDNIITKTKVLDDSMVIHTVNLFSDSRADHDIVNWIVGSYELLEKRKISVG